MERSGNVADRSHAFAGLKRGYVAAVWFAVAALYGGRRPPPQLFELRHHPAAPVVGIAFSDIAKMDFRG